MHPTYYCFRTGPGGVKCSCCVHTHGKRLKRFLNKLLRRKEKISLKKLREEDFLP